MIDAAILRRWVVVVFLVVVVVGLGIAYWDDCKSRVQLLRGGKAAFFRGDFLHRDKFDLSFRRSGRGGAWHISGGRGDGGELAVPFQGCCYNKYRELRLEEDGRVYVIDKHGDTRVELRVVDGEWSMDVGDHWNSIFDFYPE